MTRTQTLDCDEFDLDLIVLREGSHGEKYKGEVCMVECSNIAAACIPELREKFGAAPFSDDHPSICRVIRGFCIAWNDGITDDELRTQLLKPYVTRILGTERGKKVANERAWMATDWLVRTFTPAFLRLVPELRPHADALEAIGQITGAAAARAAQPALDAALAASNAARSAAESAARSAAESAARSAARSAAESAARSALAPTVLALQQSALQLLDDMIAVGTERRKAA